MTGAGVEPTIALVFSPEPWVERLHRHLADHGGARVRDIVLEPALALEDDYDTLVVSHRWPGLTRPFVDAVHQRGRCVLGVFDRDEPAGRAHLDTLGADAAVEADSAIDEFLEVIVSLAPAGRVAADTVRRHAEPARRAPTVVTGPSGAGTSEVALGLAAALAARGESTVLVDADEFASSLATRLGLPIEPNLRTAVDAVEYGLGDLAAAVVGFGGSSLRVVCGFASAAAVAQVRPRDVVDVVTALCALHAQIVVDVAGGANGDIGRALLADAGAVIGIGASHPVGVTRMLGWAAGLPRDGAPVHLAFNRAPADKYQRAELVAELYRVVTPASLTFIPADRRVERAAWAGDLVGRGPFTASVTALAQTAVPRGARPGRAVRKGRRRARSAA
jgi:MinD-like ATPase involved in chromosome partitioning or flagellar assembly